MDLKKSLQSHCLILYYGYILGIWKKIRVFPLGVSLRNLFRFLNKVNVGYLPPIPFPPTDLKVIAAVIRRTENIMKEIKTNFIFMEVYQAIYTKILYVKFSLKDKGEDLYPTIIPWMGGFHISMCMLRTIHSLFKR